MKFRERNFRTKHSQRSYMRRRRRRGGVRRRRLRRPGRARTPRRSGAGRGGRGRSGGAGGQPGHGAAAWEPKGAWRRGWRRWSSAPSFSLKRGCTGSLVPAVAVRMSGVQLPPAYPVVSQKAEMSARVVREGLCARRTKPERTFSLSLFFATNGW